VKYAGFAMYAGSAKFTGSVKFTGFVKYARFAKFTGSASLSKPTRLAEALPDLFPLTDKGVQKAPLRYR